MASLLPTWISGLKTRIQRVGSPFKFAQMGGGYGSNDPWGGLWRSLSGSTFDYRREAGIAWENSIVVAGMAWTARNFTRARLAYQRPTGLLLENGEPAYEEVPGHPFIELWNQPNPYYSRGTLLKGLVLSRMVDGNSFLYINRGVNTGLPLELYYVPHFTISPRWLSGSSVEQLEFPGQSTDYLNYWEHRVDGEFEKWKPLDVFHWRDGIDPLNLRRGFSPLNAVLREICTDNCASTMSASLLRNNNIPGLIVSAKQGADGKSSFASLTDAQEEKIRSMAQQKWVGDRVGELAVIPTPVEITRQGFSPQEMDLSTLRRIPVERILAQWGIPMAVAGMAAGVEQTKVGATMAALISLAWDQCLIPMQDDLADELTFWASREFGAWYQPGDRLVFDRSKVTALQADTTELHTRVRLDFQADLIKRSEGRRIFGMSAGPEDEVYFSEAAGSVAGSGKGFGKGRIGLEFEQPDDSDGGDSPEDQEEDNAAYTAGSKKKN